MSLINVYFAMPPRHSRGELVDRNGKRSKKCYDYNGTLGFEAQIRYEVTASAEKSAGDSAGDSLWLEHDVRGHANFYDMDYELCGDGDLQVLEYFAVSPSGFTGLDSQFLDYDEYGIKCPKPCIEIAHVVGKLRVVRLRDSAGGPMPTTPNPADKNDTGYVSKGGSDNGTEFGSTADFTVDENEAEMLKSTYPPVIYQYYPQIAHCWDSPPPAADAREPAVPGGGQPSTGGGESGGPKTGGGKTQGPTTPKDIPAVLEIEIPGEIIRWNQLPGNSPIPVRRDLALHWVPQNNASLSAPPGGVVSLGWVGARNLQRMQLRDWRTLE